ncbi:MAG: urea carboxylase-associated family protein [Nitrosomonas sp.]|uniref:urea amidolyase associated protein UAAP1 n=1 Tax=Nitrosomonas sp. TaxID=42353 RepID=UPI0025F49FD7|nr:urea amidolyase associated protein UAAP1 [Nitrosomonas sp.]MBY0473530.1 urea carboxylase-associated family protein [Nitrosomonas sp.]
MNQSTIIWKQVVPGGCHWSGIIRRGTTLRLIDVDGGANAAVLFFNHEEKLERYNMADTLKSQHTFRLTKGHACHSDMGRIFCCITTDTCGWHDTVCGLSDANLIQQKYGAARFQEHRNQMFRSGLDGLLIELGKWGLGMRDIVANINFFSKITTDATGELAYQVEHSKTGDYVDLSFVMDTLVALSTAPHPLDPKKPYQPGTVNLELFNTPPQAIKECLHISENIRALQNVQNFYCEGAK